MPFAAERVSRFVREKGLGPLLASSDCFSEKVEDPQS
jgi:hypothetical protein